MCHLDPTEYYWDLSRDERDKGLDGVVWAAWEGRNVQLSAEEKPWALGAGREAFCWLHQNLSLILT